MIDPISILTLTNELLHVVDSCVSVYQVIKDIDRVKSEVKWLAKELTIFRTSFQWISRDVRYYLTPPHDVDAETQNAIAQILQHAKADVNKIRSSLLRIS